MKKMIVTVAPVCHVGNLTTMRLRQYLITVLFLICGTMTALAQQPERKKVAVVLSGGGAKGMAHIGALKVIERAGIPIDMVTGTSMGSIVGGLYAIGYNANILDSLVRQQDWTFILSDKEDLSHQSLSERQKQNTYIISRAIQFGKGNKNNGGIIHGKNLADLFQRLTTGYTDSLDFNTLPIPFACVATNIVDNTEYDFHSGYLAQAMRASMAIPAAFSPVRLDDMVLVDGGLRNNYPADLAREMGADIIIGVTVQGPPKTAEDLGSTASILSQIVDVNCKNKYDENLSITDVPIRVNTIGYGSASFTPAAIDTLIRRGEEEAMRHWDELIALRRRIGIDDTFQPRRLTPIRPNVLTEKVRIAQLEFENMTKHDEYFLRSKYKLQEGDSIDTRQADLIATTMRMDLFYQEATCQFYPVENGARVVLTAEQKKSSQINLGVRFDNEEMVALQVNADIPLRTSIPTDIDLTLRLGKRVMARADLSFHPRGFFRPTLSYIYRHNDINIYNKGDKDHNLTYNQHIANLSLFNFNIRNLNVDFGARWDYYHYEDLLIDHQAIEMQEALRNDHYFSYHARLRYNSEDHWYFPIRGAKFQAQYAYYTDDLAQLDGKKGMSDVSAFWRMSFALNDRLTLQSTAYGRLLFGSRIPSILDNTIGGEWCYHYVDQQMPFAGVGYIERTDPHFAAIQLQGQQRITDNNFILLRLATAAHASKFNELFEHRLMLGCSLSYYYNTPFGPLGCSLGYSDKTKEPAFYINLGFVF